MVNKIKIDKETEDDIYEPSDSEEDYTEREKSLLNKVRSRNKREENNEQEVLGFDDEDDDEEDEDEDKDENYESDFEDERNDEGISNRAWGKKRKDFYSTDFVDQDYSSYNEKEMEQAEQEELESKAIQQRLAQQLDEADFTLNVYKTTQVTEKEEEIATKTHLKSDLSDLTQRQQMQLFTKDSPEFEGLVQDFQKHLKESEQLLEPILAYVHKHQLPSLPIFDFVTTKNNLTLAYCCNVSFYLVMKSQRLSIKNHPLVKRLVQMRQLLLQLEERYERVVKPQLEQLLVDINEGHELNFDDLRTPEKAVKKPKKLQLLSAIDVDQEINDESASEDDKGMGESQKMETDSDDDEGDSEGEEEYTGEERADERRQITYQMSKNKGLTPYRKKELRNPRVKHRNKFRKAVIRRKGAVRTVRKELKRYGGEISGIKATTKKGTKIR